MLLIVALATALATTDPPAPTPPADPFAEETASPPAQDGEPDDAGEGGFRAALAGGRSWVNLRYRFENVDDDAFDKEASASTLRTVLGYETGVWHGFSALIEAEDVSPVGNDELYDSGVNGVTDRPAVIDPDGTETNQAYVKYTGWADTDVRAGRQRITIDNHRFVGNVGWRQNEQTFDAYSVSTRALDGLDLFAAYVYNVNRVFGEDNPAGDTAMASILLDLSHDFEGVGTLRAYAFDLDYDTVDALSTTTYGASFAGKRELESLDLLYRAGLADQSDAGDNPNDVDAGYINLEAGVGVGGFEARIGSEVLEGSGDPGDKFTTPLATLHKFNGWVDKFLVTPDDGLEDLYLSVGYDWNGTKLTAVYHEFSADSGGDEYGTEIDLMATRTFDCGVTGGVKFGSYSADDFSEDTTKAWVWLAYSF